MTDFGNTVGDDFDRDSTPDKYIERKEAMPPLDAAQVVKQGDTIVVWFSCGAASAVAAKKTIEKYGDIANVRVVNNPVAEEHPDNRRFLRDVEKWIGRSIEIVTPSKFPNASAVSVWEKKRYMSGVAGAPCTFELKRVARQEWESANHHDHIVLGFTFDEQARAERFRLTERSNLLDVLIDAKMTKVDCFELLVSQGLQLPEVYKLGYPNANCIGCVKSTSPDYWNLVRKTFPSVFDDRARQSRAIGCKLVRMNGTRIYLDELPEGIGSLEIKTDYYECGLFCEEIK
jgi:hypothetical protein